jgi:hypothetical protein
VTNNPTAVGDSDSVQFNSTGTFVWAAFYSGDANNTFASSDCSTELLVVNPLAPGITTVPNPTAGNVNDALNDKATLTGGFNPTGTITFELFSPSDPSCSGTPVYSEDVTVNGNGDYVATGGGTGSNVASSAGTWNWVASYTSGDANNNDVSSACGAESMVITQPTNSQITPTNTTCQQFTGGQAPTLDTINYSVKNGVISQVDPGVFFYWVEVTAVAGSNTFTIDQSITSGNFNAYFLTASGSFAYTSNCTKVTANISQSTTGDVSVQFNAASAGTYVIGIKYSTANVKGATAPSPSTVDYTFQVTGDASTLQGLQLKRK